MDQTRAALQQQVAGVLANPNIPDNVKVQFQNFAGMAYYNQGLLSMTIASNQANTLSPFASMNSTINVDFHAFDGNNLAEAPGPPNPGFRRFPMSIEVGGTQLIQAMLYTTQDLVGRYVTQRQATNVMPAFGRLFKSFVTTLRQREGAMSCAGVPNHQSCNKSNIVILICKMESGGQRHVCGVPFCKGHAKSRAANRNKQIFHDKKIYLLAQPIVDAFYSDGAKTTASAKDIEGDQLLVEEEEVEEGI